MAESRWTGSAIVIMEIWLPEAVSPSRRMLTGTIAFSGSGGGGSPRALEQRPHRARDGREADVVERAADAARRPQLVAPGVVADEDATRADGRVERARRRGRQHFLGGRVHHAPGVAQHARDRRGRVRGGGRSGAQRADAVGERPRDRVQRPADASGAPPWLPGDRGLRCHVGLGVEDQVDDLQRGEPVDERVVDLAHHPDPPVLEPGHQEDLPQRPRPVQRSGEDRRAERLEARVADPVVRRCERHDVGREIELGVIDPARLGQAQRRRLEPPAAPRDLVQPSRRPVSQRLHRRARTPGRRREHRAEADVHMGLRRLKAQERAVDGRQPPAMIRPGGARPAGAGVLGAGL